MNVDGVGQLKWEGRRGGGGLLCRYVGRYVCVYLIQSRCLKFRPQSLALRYPSRPVPVCIMDQLVMQGEMDDGDDDDEMSYHISK